MSARGATPRATAAASAGSIGATSARRRAWRTGLASLDTRRGSRHGSTMCGVLALLFFAVPAVEIYVLFQVGGVLGAGATLLLVAVTALVGATLAKRQGLAALRGLQESLAGGREVGRAATEAVLVLVAGITLLTPGFVTDVIGLALLVPPVRRGLAGRLADSWAGNAMVMDLTPPWQQKRPRRGDDEDPPPPGVIDV